MRDNVMLDGKWEFDQEVTDCFDEMLERSIPAYADMRELVTRIGKRYVQRRTSIIDLGCSTGEAINPFIQTFGCQNNYRLYDVSQPMLEKTKQNTMAGSRKALWMFRSSISETDYLFTRSPH